MTDTTIGDALTITPKEIEAAVRRVHAQHPELAVVLEAMDDASGVALCTTIAAMFVNNISDFHRARSMVELRTALNLHGDAVADRLLRAVIIDAVYNGGPRLAMEHLNRAEQALVIW